MKLWLAQAYFGRKPHQARKKLPCNGRRSRAVNSVVTVTLVKCNKRANKEHQAIKKICKAGKFPDGTG
jgi:hypothetical protein